jgi:hypothetical protein
MSVSYPITFPSVGITRFDLRFKKSVAMSESPFTYKQQVHDFGGGKWEAEVTLAPLTYEQSRSVDAFFVGLEGRKGTFLMSHPLHTVNGNADVDSESVGATDIDLDGTSEFVAGTFFSIANHLYMMTSAKATGSNQTVQIQPPLRTATTTNSVLDFTLPVGTWRLSTNEVNSYADINGLFYYSFSCTEAV